MTTNVNIQRFVNVSEDVTPERMDYAKLCGNLWKFMRTYQPDGPRCQLDPMVILRLLEKNKEIMKKEAMIITVTGPTVVFGPIYGEGDSMITLMSQAKKLPPDVTYIMLGGYLGRGFAQLEVLFYLLSLKAMYPDKVVMLKGHHEESISIETMRVKDWVFGRNIVKEAHLEEIVLELKQTCAVMSAGALLNGQILCMPGGPGPKIREYGLQRLTELKKGYHGIGEKKMIMEAAWAVLLLNEEQKDMHGMPFFTQQQASEFCKKHNLTCIVRGRQMVDEGYLNKPKEVLTLISAVAYLDNFRNYAAVLTVEHNKGRIIRYKMEEGEQMSLELIKPGMGRNAVV